jgi:hypothetical protein
LRSFIFIATFESGDKRAEFKCRLGWELSGETEELGDEPCFWYQPSRLSSFSVSGGYLALEVVDPHAGID